MTLSELNERLGALRGHGVARASFHPDGTLASVEFEPGQSPVSPSSPEPTRPAGCNDVDDDEDDDLFAASGLRIERKPRHVTDEDDA